MHLASIVSVKGTEGNIWNRRNLNDRYDKGNYQDVVIANREGVVG